MIREEHPIELDKGLNLTIVVFIAFALKELGFETIMVNCNRNCFNGL